MSTEWKMKPKSGDGDWELPPSGNHLAVCVAMLDLGTQQDAFQGKPREAHQLAIVWELVGQTNTKTGRAHAVVQKYNASLHRKANLRKALESWRGQPIKDDEEFDIFKVVGASCLLQINHDQTASGNSIYTIDAVTAVPKNLAKQSPSYPIIKYRIDDGPDLVPIDDWLPLLYGKTIHERIKECVEFSGKKLAAAAAPKAEASPPFEFQDHDDIPF